MICKVAWWSQKKTKMDPKSTLRRPHAVARPPQDPPRLGQDAAIAAQGSIKQPHDCPKNPSRRPRITPRHSKTAPTHIKMLQDRPMYTQNNDFRMAKLMILGWSDDWWLMIDGHNWWLMMHDWWLINDDCWLIIDHRSSIINRCITFGLTACRGQVWIYFKLKGPSQPWHFVCSI